VTLSAFYIVVAALFQTGWLLATKALSKDALKNAFRSGVAIKERWLGLWPPLAYLSTGIGNIAFLTLSMERLPSSVVYAMWTGVVMIFAAGTDRLLFNKRLNRKQYVYLAMVLAGAAGLNFLSKSGSNQGYESAAQEVKETKAPQ
jgi:multidrug transporter EmrE-like cation transporter